MAIAIVGTPATKANVGTATYTITIAPTAGNSLYVLNTSVANGTGTGAVSDNIGGTSGWNKVDDVGGGTATNASMWRKDNIPSGITTLTITSQGGSAPAAVIVIELSGTNTTNSQDAHNSVAGTGTNPTSPSVTTAFTNELAIGYMASNTTNVPTAGSGYSNLVTITSTSTVTAAVEFQSLANGTSLTAPFVDAGTATGWIAGIVTVKGTTSSAAGIQGSLLLLGVGS